jgi:putative photosynthetic complex assembly protein 2
MTDYALPILATLALWWGSTGAIFYVDNLPPRTYPYTLAAATVLVIFALCGLAATVDDTRRSAAYGAFSYGLICWGWQIVTFYTGAITGPCRTPCPQELRGLARFVQAVRTSLYHEMSALVGAVILLAITHGRANQIGFWTYVTLWWMHESAKLNVFFGVPNLGVEMLPERLRYLASYMTRRPMNMFFPLSVTISTIITTWLASRAASATTSFTATGAAMIGTLMALAVAEHWFLVAPLNGNALWAPMARRSAADASALLEGEFAALESFVQQASLQAPHENWCAALPPFCDSRHLAHVLELAAAGAFGEVEAVKGAMRTRAHWVAFEINGSRARMTPFAPQRLQEPLIVATGRRFDRQRLMAALENCAA